MKQKRSLAVAALAALLGLAQLSSHALDPAAPGEPTAAIRLIICLPCRLLVDEAPQGDELERRPSGSSARGIPPAPEFREPPPPTIVRVCAPDYTVRSLPLPIWWSTPAAAL